MHGETPFRSPKVLLIGDYMWPWYQEACAHALERIGCEVVRFGWFSDFWHWIPGHTEPVYHSVYHRAQYRYQLGPTIWRIHRRLLRIAGQTKPDIVWFYNVTLISPAILRKMRDLLPDTVFCQYSNDNPFSPTAKARLWRQYLASSPYFDVHFAFRHSNIADYHRLGARHVHLLRAYFIPEDEYPIAPDEIPERFKCDVVFAGHYENDGRVDMLEAVSEAGFKLNLFGGGWDAALDTLRIDSPLRAKYPIMPATGADYRYAICGAKVALSFLSNLNQDTYTRRSFQIPAMKTAMLSQYTDDLASLFQPGIEAAFFENADEMLGELRRLVDDRELRESIAAAGYERVYSDGHDVTTRMKTWLTRTQSVHAQSTGAKCG
jgi:spore maturation protein CgeB